MICVVIIVRYPKLMGYFGVLSMALFHLPLMFNKKISFYKLLGCGKNGTFDIHPDWRQWAILTVSDKKNEVTNSGFIGWYIKLFNCSIQTIVLKPVSSHGTWDGKKVFGEMPHLENNIEGKIAILTRATIRVSKLKSFWKNVPDVSAQMKNAKGLITSLGIGEIPFVKQATLSIWSDIESMKAFAYQMKAHQTVIQKTRKEDWYSEDMFTRFEVISIE
ncbi:MAG: spheroidene monooxygenase [Chitinophagaceae bacterium]